MPEPIVAADASPAGSSPAASIHAEPTDSLESLSATELQTWRETGALPSTSPVTDAVAASSSAVPAVPVASTDASSQAASEPAAAATPGADKRIPELLRDRAEARERAERAERRLADLERGRQLPPDARPAASSTAPAGPASAPVAPDPETFTYGTSDPEYLKALTAHTVATTLAAERATWERGQADARAREERERVSTAFEGKAAEARTKHPDFDAVALLAPTEIPQGSATDLFVLEDPAGAEILYHLQQPANAGERRRILGLAPLAQLKELVRLGDRLTSAAPAAQSTQAPPPAPTLSTRATPADPVERALAMGDSDDATGAYIRAQNARDLAARKR